MPRKSKNPHVTWLVSSTSSRPVQKSRKPKFQPQNRALAREIRRRKFMVEKLANRGRHNPSKRHRAERKQRKQNEREQRVQRPIEPIAQNDASMNTTSKLAEMPEKREFPLMYKGVILGLMIGTGLSAEEVASKIPDQFLELLFKTPSVLFRNMQFPDENLSRQSGHVLPSAENLCQEPKHGSPAVVGNPSQNLQVSPGCSNQTECPDKTIDLTSIYTQTDSWSQLQNLGKEPAPSVIHSMPNLVPIQVEDPMLKPDEEPAQKTEVCLNQSEGQIGDGDCNAGDCHPQNQ